MKAPPSNSPGNPATQTLPAGRLGRGGLAFVGGRATTAAAAAAEDLQRVGRKQPRKRQGQDVSTLYRQTSRNPWFTWGICAFLREGYVLGEGSEDKKCAISIEIKLEAGCVR